MPATDAAAVPPELPAPLSIMGVPVHPFRSYRHAVDCVAARIDARAKTFCVAINPEKVYRAVHDPELAGILRAADVGICDGGGIVLAAKFLHGRRIVRCTGIQLFLELIAEAERRGWRVFLLGALPASSAGAQAALLARHPGLRIAGRQDGFFTDDAPVVRRINEAGADCLFVAMGSPRQERWITEHATELRVPLRMGIGGSLDVLSGKARRAPAIFRRTGTEFLYRLARDPRRWRRQMACPLFVAEMLRRRVRRAG